MKKPKKTCDNTAAAENEIKRGRKFSLAEALGREAAGIMKGGSPVAASQRVLLGIDNLLETRLHDPEGSLQRTIMAQLKNNPPLIAEHFGHPEEALKAYLVTTLESSAALDSLIRDTDARWGREYGERPFFNSPDRRDHPADPYTPESVATSLQELLDTLS